MHLLISITENDKIYECDKNVSISYLLNEPLFTIVQNFKEYKSRVSDFHYYTREYDSKTLLLIVENGSAINILSIQLL